MMVVALHCSSYIDAYIGDVPVFDQLASGVDVFFVISGFIISRISKPKPHIFIAERFLRIAPLYWSATLFLFALSLTPLADTHSSLLTSLLFINPEPVLHVGWTLNYEMAFYLIMTIGMLTGQPILVTMSALLIAALSGYWLCLEFAFGILIERMTFNRFALPSMLIGVMLIVINPDVPRIVGWGIPAALVVYGALNLPGIGFGVLTGDASYSIYVTHPLVIPALLRFTDNIWIAYIVGLSASWMIGIAVFMFFERPVHKTTRALMRSRQQRLAAHNQ